MALNPKLSVYTVALNPRKKNIFPTFRDLFKKKFFEDSDADDCILLNDFLQCFMNSLGTTNFRQDTKNKKDRKSVV